MEKIHELFYQKIQEIEPNFNKTFSSNAKNFSLDYLKTDDQWKNFEKIVQKMILFRADQSMDFRSFTKT